MRSGLVFKAQRLLYHSTLGLRVIKKKTRRRCGVQAHMGDEDSETDRDGREVHLVPLDCFRAVRRHGLVWR